MPEGCRYWPWCRGGAPFVQESRVLGRVLLSLVLLMVADAPKKDEPMMPGAGGMGGMGGMDF